MAPMKAATRSTATAADDALLDDDSGSSAGTAASAADVSGASAAPQRHAVTLRGTRLPQEGQSRLRPVWLGMSHNKGLNNR